MPIWLAGKRRGGLDRSRKVKARANSSKVAFFYLWFNSINFRLLRVSVTTDAEKADDPNIGVADVDKPGMSIADLEEGDRVETDRVEINGAEVDIVEADRT